MPRATTDHHPATHRGPRRPPPTPARWPTGRMIPRDPTEGATFAQVLKTARILHATLDHLGMPSYAKTTGSRGVHVYVPIVRGPTQKEVWTVARTISIELARHHPQLITAEYSMARRPRAHVLVAYNQNAWGRTLASVYSVRPTPRAAA